MAPSAPEYETSQIRNVVVVGHGGSGKTTLVDAMAYIGGATHRRGSVERGNALTDFTPEETEHGMSINLAVAPVPWKGAKLNLIDTPGFTDFFGEVVAAVRVADGALVVVSAQDGVEIGTEKAWEACEARGIPRVIFVSMMGRETASFEDTFEQVKEGLSGAAIPVEVPIGSGEEFKGIVNLFSGRAHMYKAGATKGEYDVADIPEELQSTVDRYREDLIETIAAADDELLEAYLEGEELDRERVLEVLAAAMRRGELFPVFCGSGDTGWGVRAVMNKLVELLPSPAQAGPFTARGRRGDKAELAGTDDEPFTAVVFKTTSEPHVGELSYFRVFTGTVDNGATVYNPAHTTPERISHLAAPAGSQRVETARLHAGDIGVVAKLKDTHTGDTLCADGRRLQLEAIEWPPTDISIAVAPKHRGDEDKLANGLNKLHEEDPTFRSGYEAELGQTIARGCGELHLNICFEKLKRKYQVEVETEEPRIPYRETITSVAEGQGRHKKQTGGRGQFGDCWIRLKPLERGEGYVFEDRIKGGVIPAKFVPAVDKGVQEASARGVLAGYPMVDFGVECYDGSYHSVDSSEQAFKVAGSIAFKNVAQSAGPVLLEPIMELEVRTPEEYMGEVIGDLNQRRGRILGMESKGRWQVVRARVPLAELHKYAAAVRSLTQGKGTHTRKLHSYEPVPPHVAEKVIAEAKEEREAAAAAR
ncbi:MAG: elongation factor G [Gemmatimonadota bacterium]|jgi:elongation factor G|nr:MAG: elongation factor G [Gemmatimonadota bacterium]